MNAITRLSFIVNHATGLITVHDDTTSERIAEFNAAEQETFIAYIREILNADHKAYEMSHAARHGALLTDKPTQTQVPPPREVPLNEKKEF